MDTRRLPKNRLLLPLFALTLTACGAPGSGFENPFTVPVTLTVTPAQITLAPGTRAHISVTAQAGTRSLGTPTLDPINTSGIQGVPDGTGMTITVSEKTPEGTYGLPLKGNVGRGSGQATLNLTVQTKAEAIP